MSEQITPNPSVPSQVVQEVKFPKFVNNLGIIPTSYKDSMSYYECLAWLCKFLEETVIPTVNENGEAVEELQALYVELNSYVTNYFDNLDVQEEINNKLDEMVEEGTLQEIIASYLNSKAVFGYDTVSEMKNATNLINGSYAKTLGFHSKNDGGGALYKLRTITNDDVVDNMFIIEMNDETNNLVCELIYIDDTINVKTIGAKGDNLNDDTLYFSSILSKNLNIFVPNGTYIISNTLNISNQLNIKGNGTKNSMIKYIGNNYLFNISTDINSKAKIESLRFYGTTTNSFLYANRNSFGVSFILRDFLIDYFYNEIFHLVSVFDPIIQNGRIISNGKIVFRTYDGAYGENSFSNNVSFEHIYYTGDPDPAGVIFDLENVRFLHLLECQFEKITTLIQARHNTKNIILDHSWVESCVNLYDFDSSSSGIQCNNTNIILTTNLNKNHNNVFDYVFDDQKRTVFIKANNNDTFNQLQLATTPDQTLANETSYNPNNSNYSYQQLYKIGTKETKFMSMVNLKQVHIRNSSSLSYNLNNIDYYSAVPMKYKVTIDCSYSNNGARTYQFDMLKTYYNGYRKFNTQTVAGYSYDSITDTISITNGTLSISSTDTMNRCIMIIEYNMIGEISS